MRTLVVTNLFPNRYEPGRGIFNFLQLKALARYCEIEVIAPSPWFPGMRLFGSNGAGGLEPETTHGGIHVHYPRYPYLPKVGQRFHPALFRRGIASVADDVIRRFTPDVILATWSYPDVVATAAIARKHNLPMVAKVHGTDINDYLLMSSRARRVVKALGAAAAIVSVSEALKHTMVAHGVADASIEVIYNGVDHRTFGPTGEVAERNPEFNRHVLFVGNLKPVKKVDVLLDAIALTQEDTALYIIGTGPLEGMLRDRCRRLGIERRVSFLGTMDHEAVASWMRAADVLCLPSRMEGVPNVLLEAIACGTPVVASRVGGIPEVVPVPQAGMLVAPGDVESLARAIRTVTAKKHERHAVSRNAGRFNWDRSGQRLFDTLSRAAAC